MTLDEYMKKFSSDQTLVAVVEKLLEQRDRRHAALAAAHLIEPDTESDNAELDAIVNEGR